LPPIDPSERRRAPRTEVQLPVKVRPKVGRQNDAPEYSAVTRDLSTSGVFLYSQAALEPGTKLELVVMLPPGMGLGSGGWTLCEASVVRVEQADGKGVGIAATLDRIDLLPELS